MQKSVKILEVGNEMKFRVLSFPLLLCLQNFPFIEYPRKTRLDWSVDRYLSSATEKQCLTPARGHSPSLCHAYVGATTPSAPVWDTNSRERAEKAPRLELWAGNRREATEFLRWPVIR